MSRSFLTEGIRSRKSQIQNIEKGGVSRDYSDTDSVSEKVLSDVNYIYRGGEGIYNGKVCIYV